ncbi:PREDICTED: centrosome-associated protein 350-like [Crocodylus porosus]|uniref:centrosome-associated protein 350-like n=1 Tax=Crocodylus porosus TaxID=8502 RepID=UPI00093BC817|nr:PREDICTED: centrosome-associated protein 350-like [Crocodylus porosus]
MRPRGGAPGSPPRPPACVHRVSAGSGAIWGDASLDRARQPATPSISGTKGPVAPELEGPRKKSHAGKLQQLKERIREQRQRHRALTQGQEQPCAAYAGDLLHGRPPKRKVRKVAAAPAAPVYRGFSAVDLQAAQSLPGKETERSQAAKFMDTECWRDYNYCPAQRGPSATQRKKQGLTPSKSPVPKKTRINKGSNSFGAFAWREGQKLAAKLLGPPPKFPKMRDVPENAAREKNSEPGKESIATLQGGHSCREKAGGGGDRVGNSPEEKSCRVTQSGSFETDSSALAREARQRRRDRRTQSQAASKNPSASPQRDAQEGKAGDPRQYLGVSPLASPGSSTATPSFQEEKPRSFLNSSCSRGKGTSPRGTTGSNWPAQRGSEKENLPQPLKKKVNVGRSHPYSPQEVHEFMHRKTVERKKRSLEERESVKQAREARTKRLQEVYRKQREAFARKPGVEESHVGHRGTALPAPRPRSLSSHERRNARSLERTFMEWADTTSHTLLGSEEQGSSNLRLETSLATADPLDFSPSLASERGFLSPLKLQDLELSPSPHQCPPAQSVFLPLQAARCRLKASASEDTSALSPYRNKRERVKAIHALARALGARIEIAADRLKAMSHLADSDDGGLARAALGPLGRSPPCSWHKMQEKGLDGRVNPLLGLDDPLSNGSWLSPDQEQDGLDWTRRAHSAAGAAAQGWERGTLAPLSDTLAVGKEVPWAPARQDRLDDCKILSRACKGLAEAEGCTDTDLSRGELMTSPSHRGLVTSPRRAPAEQRNRCASELWKEEAPTLLPKQTLGASTSRRSGPCASAAGRIETQESLEKDLGRGKPACRDAEEGYRSHLESIKQASHVLALKLQAYQLQQERQLAVLSEKAKLEAQESQRSLDELLKHHVEGLDNARADSAVRSRFELAKQEPRRCRLEGDPKRENAAAASTPGGHSPRPSVQRTETDGNTQPTTKRRAPGEANLDLSTHRPERGDSSQVHPSLNPLSAPISLPKSKTRAADDSGDSSEQTDSVSQWSEASQFYGGSSTFSQFGLAMAEQYLREEELRARHQAALLRLREEALQEKTRAELAWLQYQERCLDNLRDTPEMTAVAEKQQEILTKLKQEQAEILHLRNIYRAAHQERKLLLKQQRDILLIQKSTAQLQQELHSLAGQQQFIKSLADVKEAIKKAGKISNPTAPSTLAESTTQTSKRPGVSRNSCAQKRNKQSGPCQGHHVERERTSLGYRSQAEEPQRWERTFGADPKVPGKGVKKSCDAVNQTIGPVLMDEDLKDAEPGDRSQVLLHLEDGDSAEMDKATLIPGPEGDERYEFLESNPEEKEHISNAGLDPKDNKAINSHDSEFTMKGLGMLSTLCNLCLAQVENSLQETDVPVIKEEKKDVFAAREETPASEGEGWAEPFCDSPHNLLGEGKGLKSCSERLGSAASSTKSQDSSQSGKSNKSCHSLPEFQKVSAVRIDISESFASASELGAEDGQDTDVSIPEEFAMQDDKDVDVFSNPSTKMRAVLGDGNELLTDDKCDEQVLPDETLLLFHGSGKYLGVVPGCDHIHKSHPDTPLNNGNSQPSISQTEEPFPLWSDDLAIRRCRPHMDTSTPSSYSENCNLNRVSTPGKSEQDRDSFNSLLHSNAVWGARKSFGLQGSSSTTIQVEKDGRDDDLSVDQSKTELLRCHKVGSSKHLSEVAVGKRVSLPPKKSMTDDERSSLPIASPVVSRDLAGLEGEAIDAGLLGDRPVSGNPTETASPRTHAEGVPVEAAVRLSDAEILQRASVENQKSPATGSQTPKPTLSSVSSKQQSSRATRCRSECKDDVTFVSDDEVLPPVDEDTLSEILSPVDEVLSYGSIDLPSSNKKDFSFQSRDLPTPPIDVGGIKSDSVSISTEDFPSPPEQLLLSETRDNTDADVSVIQDQLCSLPDEEVRPPSPELGGEVSVQDGKCLGLSWGKENTSDRREDLLEQAGGENKSVLQQSGLSLVSNPILSSQVNKSTECLKKPSKPFLTLSTAQEEANDPLLSFEVGNRVLVKYAQPGTLMFKGYTNFDKGYWAGVALDKPEGDHDGTYRGVKYFVCAKDCGVFVRPDQISHLLEDSECSCDYTGDEDSFSDGDAPSKGASHSADNDQKRTGYMEEESKDVCSTEGPASKENKSRSQMSSSSVINHESLSWKHSEFTLQTCSAGFESDKKTTEQMEIKRTFADVLPVRNKDSLTGQVGISRNISCLLQDQEKNKLADDISSELTTELPLDTLIAFSATGEHKYKSVCERKMRKDGFEKVDSGKSLLFKKNHIDSLSEQSAAVSDTLLCNFDTLNTHSPHTAQTIVEKIMTKFVDDALKEYRKIKRKQGGKADELCHGSAETAQATLPFLIKIPDAGDFGSAEGLDQLISVQPTQELKLQRQNLYGLDQWHSAPWKKTVEVPLLVPHNRSYVKIRSARAVEELWTLENIYTNCKRINVPKAFKDHDISDDDLEAESKRIYNQIIFDLTRELLQEEYAVMGNSNTCPWLKENLGSRCSRRLQRKPDVSEVKSIIQGEIIKIMNFEKNDLEMKRKLLNMTKYGNCKRDRVDLILIQELHKEESQWIYYDDDELTVKRRLSDDIFDSLILDTVRVLNEIYLRRTCD